MKNHFKIVLATDYSDSVMNAERYAVDFAKSTGSVLKIIHAFEAPLSIPVPPFELIQVDYNSNDFENEKLKQHVFFLMNTLSIEGDDLNYSYEARQGDAKKVITEAAKEMDADFIICGTHGANGFREIFLGSTSWDIIKNSEVPVMAIPEKAHYTGIKEIVFAVDYRHDEMNSIEFVTDLAKFFDAELTLLHISNSTLPKEFEIQFYEEFMLEVNECISYKKLKIRLIHFDHLIDGINTFCKDSDAQLLVMSPEKRGIFQQLLAPGASKTRSMTFHSLLPMLAVPDSFVDRNQYVSTNEKMMQ